MGRCHEGYAGCGRRRCLPAAWQCASQTGSPVWAGAPRRAVRAATPLAAGAACRHRPARPPGASWWQQPGCSQNRQTPRPGTGDAFPCHGRPCTGRRVLSTRPPQRPVQETPDEQTRPRLRRDLSSPAPPRCRPRSRPRPWPRSQPQAPLPPLARHPPLPLPLPLPLPRLRSGMRRTSRRSSCASPGHPPARYAAEWRLYPPNCSSAPKPESRIRACDVYAACSPPASIDSERLPRNKNGKCEWVRTRPCAGKGPRGSRTLAAALCSKPKRCADRVVQDARVWKEQRLQVGLGRLQLGGSHINFDEAPTSSRIP